MGGPNGEITPSCRVCCRRTLLESTRLSTTTSQRTSSFAFRFASSQWLVFCFPMRKQQCTGSARCIYEFKRHYMGGSNSMSSKPWRCTTLISQRSKWSRHSASCAETPQRRGLRARSRHPRARHNGAVRYSGVTFVSRINDSPITNAALNESTRSSGTRAIRV
jgi:hypothetical protein